MHASVEGRRVLQNLADDLRIVALESHPEPGLEIRLVDVEVGWGRGSADAYESPRPCRSPGAKWFVLKELCILGWGRSGVHTAATFKRRG